MGERGGRLQPRAVGTMTTQFSTDLPEWAKDAVYVYSEHHFSWRDRIKILCGWTVLHDCGVATEIPPGRTDPFTHRVSFRRPDWWPFKPKFVGYMAVERDD